MSTIELIGPDQSPLLLRDLYADGDPGPIVGALAHVPELCQTALPFVGSALGPSAVPLRTKEIVILRASVRMACTYCTDTHTVVASDSGLTADEVRALRQEDDPETVFTDEADRAVIAWVDALTDGPGAIPADVVARLKEHVEDHVIVDLTVTAGTTIMLNRLATALVLPTSEETRERLVELGYADDTSTVTPVAIGDTVR